MSLRTLSLTAALLAVTVASIASGAEAPTRQGTLEAPQPAATLHARHPDEIRVVRALRVEGARRIDALIVRLAPLPPGPDREALLRATASIKQDLRVRELRAIAVLAHQRGDHGRALEAERALAEPRRPVAPVVRQTPEKPEVAR
jgi:hypothetical protein